MGKINISESFQDNKLNDIVKKKYKSSSTFILDNYELIISPFRLLKLSNLIPNHNYLERLINDIRGLEYNSKDNDLYNLKQSVDLNKCTIDSINQFIQFLRAKIEPLLSSIMGVSFNGTLSVTASLYKDGNYLLCHDDRCDDRCVAFVYYLTESTDDAGGHFRMFHHDTEDGQPITISKAIPPKKNSFICFEVGNCTYHEVSEVLDDNFERLSINGWFHSDNNLNVEGLNYIDPMPKLLEQIEGDKSFAIEEFINNIYCKQSNILQAQGQFENYSFILLQDFFLPEFYEACANYLNSGNLCWENVGPANRRKYDCLNIESVENPLRRMINFMRSANFVSYLRNISELDLVPLTEKEGISTTKMILQLQKWSNGSYTMATDNDAFFHENGLDMFIFFNSDKFVRGEENFGGCTTYLASGESDSESVSNEDSELLTIEPQDNALVLVYRTSDTVRFTKYVNHHNTGYYHSICATYFQV